MATKTRMYNMIVLSILYASETWIPLKRDQAQLKAADMRYLRRIGGKTKLDKIRSKEIRKIIKQESTINIKL